MDSCPLPAKMGKLSPDCSHKNFVKIRFCCFQSLYLKPYISCHVIALGRINDMTSTDHEILPVLLVDLYCFSCYVRTKMKMKKTACILCMQHWILQIKLCFWQDVETRGNEWPIDCDQVLLNTLVYYYLVIKQTFLELMLLFAFFVNVVVLSSVYIVMYIRL